MKLSGQYSPSGRFSWISGWLYAFRSIGRQRHFAKVRQSGRSNTFTGGGRKLPPIAEVLARAGREPRAPD